MVKKLSVPADFWVGEAGELWVCMRLSSAADCETAKWAGSAGHSAPEAPGTARLQGGVENKGFLAAGSCERHWSLWFFALWCVLFSYVRVSVSTNGWGTLGRLAARLSTLGLARCLWGQKLIWGVKPVWHSRPNALARSLAGKSQSPRSGWAGRGGSAGDKPGEHAAARHPCSPFAPGFPASLRSSLRSTIHRSFWIS